MIITWPFAILDPNRECTKIPHSTYQYKTGKQNVYEVWDFGWWGGQHNDQFKRGTCPHVVEKQHEEHWLLQKLEKIQRWYTRIKLKDNKQELNCGAKQHRDKPSLEIRESNLDI